MEPSVITSVSDLDSISHQLLQLEQHGELSTSAASWIRSTAQLYERNQLRIVVVRDGNEIVAAAALVETPIRLVNRWLLAGSNHLFEPGGLVYRDDVALAVLIGKLVRVNAPLFLSRIPKDQTWIATIRVALKRRAFVVIRPAGSCPVIRLHSGWRDPLSQLSSRRRSDLRRAQGERKRLAK